MFMSLEGSLQEDLTVQGCEGKLGIEVHFSEFTAPLNVKNVYIHN